MRKVSRNLYPMRKGTPLLKSQPYLLFFLITASLLLFERVLGEASADNYRFPEYQMLDAPKNGRYALIELAGPDLGPANDPTCVQVPCRKTLKERPTNRRKGVTTILKVILASSSIVALVVGLIVGLYIRKRQNILKKRRGPDERKLKTILHNKSLDFKYSTLEKATGYFDNANKLGQGGFGTVYKGLLHDGTEIAVKRPPPNNEQRAAEDFYNEVNTISRVEHKNLVKLLGSSCSGPENLLVYEFLPNKSLDHFIFDPIKSEKLDWEKRYEIIIGIAEGLAYLHENNKIKIIHRDIKASNILLDSRLCAKIADFGLAKSFQEDTSYISTAIAGTLGYMAPEYIKQGKLTEKADVYSFGVLLLEIVAGKQNISKTAEDTETLVTKAWNHFQAGTVEQLYDPNLKLQNYHDGNAKIQILRAVHVGLLCTQQNQSLRLTMSKSLRMLTTEEILPAPTRPPFMNGDPWSLTVDMKTQLVAQQQLLVCLTVPSTLDDLQTPKAEKKRTTSSA